MVTGYSFLRLSLPLSTAGSILGNSEPSALEPRYLDFDPLIGTEAIPPGCAGNQRGNEDPVIELSLR